MKDQKKNITLKQIILWKLKSCFIVLNLIAALLITPIAPLQFNCRYYFASSHGDSYSQGRRSNKEVSAYSVDIHASGEKGILSASASQLEEISQKMKESYSSLDREIALRKLVVLPPQKNICLKSADFLVTDNRYDAKLLGYRCVEDFLEDFGFADKEPFFQYFDEDSGALLLELYYNEWYGEGGGVRYYPDKKPFFQLEKAAEGFLFSAVDILTSDKFYPITQEKNARESVLLANLGTRWYKLRMSKDFLASFPQRANSDPYAFSSPNGGNGAADMVIEYLQEDLNATSSGRPQHYLAHRRISHTGKSGNSSDIVEMDWTYRENGSLKQRNYHCSYNLYNTCNVLVQGHYDAQERLVFENEYNAQGSFEYFYIYKKEKQIPDYYFYIDHNDNKLRIQFFTRHDILADKDGKQYGIVGPSFSDNPFVEAVRAAGEDFTNSDIVTHTYAADYDGDGKEEAFVIVGKRKDNWGEPTLHMITGNLWFVDSNYSAAFVDWSRTYYASQQYICQDGKIYLFINHDIGNSWVTDVVTVRDNQVYYISDSWIRKRINDEGQVIFIQSAYDGLLDVGAGLVEGDYFMIWHSWKPYTFEFNHEQWKEIPAREVTKEEVEALAKIPEEHKIDESKYESIQYILRENGELNINTAEFDAEYNNIYFMYQTFRLGETQEWEYVEGGTGRYLIQFSGENHWEYLDNVIADIMREG